MDYPLRRVIENANQYHYPNRQMLQLEKDANGSDVVVVRHGMPITMVSTQARLQMACEWLGPASLAANLPCPAPAGIIASLTSLDPCTDPVAVRPIPRPLAQDAAYNANIKVHTYPGASPECGGGGLKSDAPRPPLMAGQGAPVLDAVSLPL